MGCSKGQTAGRHRVEQSPISTDGPITRPCLLPGLGAQGESPRGTRTSTSTPKRSFDASDTNKDLIRLRRRMGLRSFVFALLPRLYRWGPPRPLYTSGVIFIWNTFQLYGATTGDSGFSDLLFYRALPTSPYSRENET